MSVDDIVPPVPFQRLARLEKFEAGSGRLTSAVGLSLAVGPARSTFSPPVPRAPGGDTCPGLGCTVVDVQWGVRARGASGRLYKGDGTPGSDRRICSAQPRRGHG